MRRTLTLVVALVALLAVVAAGAWLVRFHLAQAWLERTLAASGYTEARFEVTAVDLGRVVVEDFELGDARDTRVQRLSARYTPWALLTGSWQAVSVDVSGLRAEIAPWDKAGEAAPAGDAGGGLRDAFALATRLERLRLSGGQLQIASPVGPWHAEIEGHLGGGDTGRRAELRLHGRSDRLRVDARVDAELVDGRVSADLDVREDDGFRIEGRASASAPWDQSPVRVNTRVVMPSGADLPWALLPGPRPSAGGLRIAGEAQGQLSLQDGFSGAGHMVRRLVAGDWSGGWRIRGRDLGFAYRFSGMDLEGTGDLVTRDGALIVESDDAARLRLASIHDALRASLGVPAFARTHADGPLELDWSGGELVRIAPSDAGETDSIRVTSEPDWRLHWSDTRGRVRLEARVSATGGWRGGLERLAIEGLDVRAMDWRAPGIRLARGRLTGEIDGPPGAPSGRFRLQATAPQLAVAGLEMQGVRANAAARLDSGSGPTRLTLYDGAGEITAARWRAGGFLRSDDALRLVITDAQWRLTTPRHWGAAARMAPFEVTLETGNRSERVRVEPGRLRAGGQGEALRLAFTDGEARARARDWAARGVEATLRPRARERFVSFDVARLVHEAEQPWLAPARVWGRVARNAGGYDLAGQGRMIGTDLGFELGADYAPAAGAASAVLELPQVRWRPDGPQPRDLAPWLGRLHDVTGASSARIEGRLDERGVAAQAEVRIEDVAMRVGGVRLAGVSGETQLAALQPVQTQQAQRLHVARVATAVPVTDVDLRWRIAPGPGEGLGLRIVEARGGFLGGRVRVENARIDTGARLNDVDVQMRNVSLGDLVDGAGIAGLSARGELSGRVPLSFGEPGLAIRGARLRGRDGHIGLRSSAARAALRQGGRDAELMLTALRDFAYDELEIDLDAPLGGRGRIGFRLDGRNPAVLSGRTLTYDIALTGAVTPLLETLAQGEPLSDELIARHLDLRAAQ